MVWGSTAALQGIFDLHMPRRVMTRRPPGMADGGPWRATMQSQLSHRGFNRFKGWPAKYRILAKFCLEVPCSQVIYEHGLMTYFWCHISLFGDNRCQKNGARTEFGASRIAVRFVLEAGYGCRSVGKLSVPCGAHRRPLVASGLFNRGWAMLGFWLLPHHCARVLRCTGVDLSRVWTGGPAVAAASSMGVAMCKSGYQNFMRFQ